MQIPQSLSLSTRQLGMVFNNTAASYKFFWMLSILQIHARREERRIEAMNVMLQYVRQKVDERFHPDGYNIGINVGEAAGQSTLHVILHLIPRYSGDVENPKGGVRGGDSGSSAPLMDAMVGGGCTMVHPYIVCDIQVLDGAVNKYSRMANHSGAYLFYSALSSQISQ